VPLRGERVALRPLVAEDLDAVYRALQEPEVARWWGAFDAARVRAELLETPETVTLAIDIAGSLAGVVTYSEELDPDKRRAGIDIFLAEAYQDQGYGTEAIRVLARHLFRERGHHRLTIDPALANERAIRA
jgi:aminoglycoside 6'-N-acetyltransferase